MEMLFLVSNIDDGQKGENDGCFCVDVILIV
jgi:hypothetical protein